MNIIDRVQGDKRKIGNKVLINPCPKCGHRNHFYIYLDTNSFYSFAGCCEGGDIVSYLVEIEGMALKDALQAAKGNIDPFIKAKPDRAVLDGLKEWRNKAYDRLCRLYRATQEAKKLPPDSVGFFVATELEGKLDHMTDILNTGTEQDWLQLYREIGKEWGL